MSRFPDLPPRKKGRGMALVSALALLSILSLTVVAFVTTMRLDHSASFSYSQSFKAEQLAEGGAWWVVKELRDEMASGGGAVTNQGFAVYTNVTAANITPQLVGTNAAMPNLVKTSLKGVSAYAPSGTAPASAPSGGVLPSAVGTATRSFNGRSVGIGRWGAPFLGTFPNTGALPYWIMVTRAGPSSLADLGRLKDAADPTNYAIGRFAYAVYDEGGLLDINVAGHPRVYGDGTSLPDAEAARRGLPAMIDLTALPGVDTNALDALLQWRGAASAASTNAFLNALYPTNLASTSLDAVVATTNVVGSVTNLAYHPYVAAGDNTFLSRQDLIAYAQAKGLTNALPYLTTFSRDLNAPTYGPTPTNLLAYVPPALPSTYPNTNNPNVLLERNATTGRLLLAQRFPLSRIALLADPKANAADILTYFGLKLDADGYSWDYRSDTAILTLDQVAALHRDPDFFELLQAAVLNGSLTIYQQPFTSSTKPIALPGMPTLMRMGADLIDQYDADGMPTVINVNKEKVAGVENLPYLQELLFWPYRPSSDRSTLQGYYLLQLWNPHQNATNLMAGPSPSQFRCLLTPSTEAKGLSLGGMALGIQPSGTTNIVVTNVFAPAVDFPASQAVNSPVYGVFTNSPAYSEPRFIDTTVPGASSSFWQTLNDGGNSRSGFQVLNGSLPDARLTGGTTSWTNVVVCLTNTVNGSSSSMGIRLEFRDSNNNWQPYQGGNPGTTGGAVTTNLTQCFSVNIVHGVGALGADDRTINTSSPFSPFSASSSVSSANIAGFVNFNFVGRQAYFFSDPRTVLPGIALGESTPNQTIRPGNNAGAIVKGNYASILATNSYTYPTAANGAGAYTPYAPYIALYNENRLGNPFVSANGLGATNTYFRDQDGVLRGGDGYYGGNPFLAGALTNRPVLLNRPFRSVGEMGYAFRGAGPWKTIDFFTADSADAGLLDYFTVDGAPLVEGRINLNTRQPVTLRAALQGAGKSEQPLVTISAAESSAIAAAITNATARAAFVNRADLVRSFSTNAVFTDTVKTQREAAVRALGELGTTRTWNLLVDVVAQVGHYPPNATDLSQFVVEGERRCWLHIAIDRYTGQVIDQKLEPYQE